MSNPSPALCSLLDPATIPSGVRLQADHLIQRHKSSGGHEHQDSGAGLQAEAWQQYKPGNEAAAYGACSVGEIQGTGAAAHRLLLVLDDCIRERKTEAA